MWFMRYKGRIPTYSQFPYTATWQFIWKDQLGYTKSWYNFTCTLYFYIQWLFFVCVYILYSHNYFFSYFQNIAVFHNFLPFFFFFLSNPGVLFSLVQLSCKKENLSGVVSVQFQLKSSKVRLQWGSGFILNQSGWTKWTGLV